MGTAPRSAHPQVSLLESLEQKVLWLSTWMIHNANHLRSRSDGLKVGGHQASSASACTILTTLYCAILRPEDRVAVKPHASPVFHALQYLFGLQTRSNLENFRGFHGAQSYPSRTKDVDDVDFSTGSVGLGVAQTLFAAIAQDYVRSKGWSTSRPAGKMVALIGDAEMDEGNIFEALLEGWKHGLRNTWWVVDYNRQSLDAVVREGLWAKFESIFRNFGWDVVVLRHGSLQRAAFAEPGGERLREWIESCPNQLYSALVFSGGAAWRKRLLDQLGNDLEICRLLERRSDDELAKLMGNLGGHDIPSLLEAFEKARTHDRPVCFIAYTIKGHGLPLAGHKDNHAGLLTPTQVEGLRNTMKVREGHEWDCFEGLQLPKEELESFLAAVPFIQSGPRRLQAETIPVPERLACAMQKSMSTQAGFGLLMHEIAKMEGEFASRVVTASPDVTVSTNLGAWVNRRGLFARDEVADVFRAERIPSTYKWDASPKGQHVELGIAESNLFIALSALGLSSSINGERVLPVGTLYDPFIERGLDALNYACYQDSRFILIATPAGLSLAPEGGAHQSIKTPLIGIGQDGLASFEPAFVDELAILLRFGFVHMQRQGDRIPDPVTCLPDSAGGSSYFRLSTRPLEQPHRAVSADLAAQMISGAYWMRKPGPNAEIVIAYQGTVAPEAIEATGLMAEDRRDIGLLSITSADRLQAGWLSAQSLREHGSPGALSHVERLFQGLPAHCTIVSVIDGHPSTLGWLGGVSGHRIRALGATRFGQTGTLADLYNDADIDTAAIIRAAQAISPGRRIRHLHSA